MIGIYFKLQFAFHCQLIRCGGVESTLFKLASLSLSLFKLQELIHLQDQIVSFKRMGHAHTLCPVSI